jgi:hypothetical protein
VITYNSMYVTRRYNPIKGSVVSFSDPQNPHCIASPNGHSPDLITHIAKPDFLLFLIRPGPYDISAGTTILEELTHTLRTQRDSSPSAE